MKKWQACIIASNSLLIISICKEFDNVHLLLEIILTIKL